MTGSATEALLAGLLAGYGIAMPVGAMSVLIVTLSAHVSFRQGLAAALGVASADGLYALAAVLGGSALAPLVTPAAPALQAAAAAVLVAIAVRGAVSAVRRHRTAGTDGEQPPTAHARAPLRTFVGMAGLTLLNPVTFVYFGVLVVGRQAETGALGPGLLFVAAAFAASVSWQTALASGGALLGRALTGARGRLVTALAGNTVILVLAAVLAWTAATAG
ncbi:LysE family transporter [Streptomyces sp. NPDC054863]